MTMPWSDDDERCEAPTKAQECNIELLRCMVTQAAGGREATCLRSPACSEACGCLREMWDAELVLELSNHSRVTRVVPLGKHCTQILLLTSEFTRHITCTNRA